METIKRSYWLKEIEQAWQKRSLIWLSGVRRAGKTFLSQNLKDVEYFDCSASDPPGDGRPGRILQGFKVQINA